jgi:YD repeat-containing protein
LGYSTQTQYSGSDQPVKTTNALGQDILVSYDDAGRTTQITNPAGVAIERYRYDGAGTWWSKPMPSAKAPPTSTTA